MKVLVTCFEPFNKQNINYSYEVLKRLNNVDKVVLDVIYDECYYQLKEQYELEKYNLIIALGEARSRNVLTIEKQAINLSSCSLPDNNDVIKQNEKIINNGKDIIVTKINYNLLKEIGELSDNAGKFVCNNLYYHLLNDYVDKSLFVHIPNCNDDSEKYNEYAKKIERIINILNINK